MFALYYVGTYLDRTTRRRLVLVLVVVFWALVVVGGLVNPGYEQGRDFISSLASRGAGQAWIGVAALVVLPLAHLATLSVLWTRADVAFAVSGAHALFTSVVSGLVVAASRISCPGGAAGCSNDSRPRQTDWMDHLHGWAVGVYGVAMVSAIGFAAADLWWRPGMRGLAVLSVVLAPVSAALLLAISLGATGGVQRMWLLVNTGWLVAVAVRVA